MAESTDFRELALESDEALVAEDMAVSKSRSASNKAVLAVLTAASMLFSSCSATQVNSKPETNSSPDNETNRNLQIIRLKSQEIRSVAKIYTSKYSQIDVKGKSLEELMKLEKNLYSDMYAFAVLIKDFTNELERIDALNPDEAITAGIKEAIELDEIKKIFSAYTETVNNYRKSLNKEYLNYFTETNDYNFKAEVLNNTPITIVFLSAEDCMECDISTSPLAQFQVESGIPVKHVMLRENGQATNPQITRFLTVLGVDLNTLPMFLIFIKGRLISGLPGKVISVEVFDEFVRQAIDIYNSNIKGHLPSPAPSKPKKKPPIYGSRGSIDA